MKTQNIIDEFNFDIIFQLRFEKVNLANRDNDVSKVCGYIRNNYLSLNFLFHKLFIFL